MLAELSFGPPKRLLKSKSSQYCVIWHRFTVSLPVLPFCGTDKSIEPERSNNNLSVAVIQLISCAPPAMSIIGSFIWTKLRPAAAKSVVLCASSAIRIEWRNLRSIYHSWESQRHVYGSHWKQNSCLIWSKYFWSSWSFLLKYCLYLWCDLLDHFATEDIFYLCNFVHIWMATGQCCCIEECIKGKRQKGGGMIGGVEMMSVKAGGCSLYAGHPRCAASLWSLLQFDISYQTLLLLIPIKELFTPPCVTQCVFHHPDLCCGLVLYVICYLLTHTTLHDSRN